MRYKILHYPLVEHDLRIIVRLIADYAEREVALTMLREIEPHEIERSGGRDWKDNPV